MCWWCRGSPCESDLSKADGNSECPIQEVQKGSPLQSAALKQAAPQRPSTPQKNLLRHLHCDLQAAEGRWDEESCPKAFTVQRIRTAFWLNASPSELEVWGRHFAGVLRVSSFLCCFLLYLPPIFFRERRIVPEFIGTDCRAVLEVRSWRTLLI